MRTEVEGAGAFWPPLAAGFFAGEPATGSEAMDHVEAVESKIFETDDDDD